MKNTAIALTFASLLLTGTPVLAANPVEPSAPSSDKTPAVTPNDARMPLPGFESYYAPYYGFGPGAAVVQVAWRLMGVTA